MEPNHFPLILAIATFFINSILLVNSEPIKYGEVCIRHTHKPDLQPFANNKRNLELITGWSGGSAIEEVGHDDGEDFDYCDFDNGECIENKCQCAMPNLTIYNDRFCQCGAPTNSFCNDQVPCLYGNVCVDNVCLCPAPSVPLADGSCTGGIHAVCQFESQCSPGLHLSCIEGTCFCKGSRHSVYEWDLEFEEGCKIRANELCTPGGQSCVSNSVCIDNGRNFVCACAEGYLSTPDGMCEKGIDLPCTFGLHECNNHRGLTCINETCRCTDDDTFFDNLKQTCVTFVGNSCGNIGILFGDKYEVGCVQNAECEEELSIGWDSRKVCTCQPGFAPDKTQGKVCVPVKEI